MGLLAFWGVLGAVLLAALGYAGYADHQARKAGKVLVPVKQSRFGRTTFVRMDKAELDEQRAAEVLARREREKAERAELGDGIQTASLRGLLLGGPRRRVRR